MAMSRRWARWAHWWRAGWPAPCCWPARCSRPTPARTPRAPWRTTRRTACPSTSVPLLHPRMRRSLYDTGPDNSTGCNGNVYLTEFLYVKYQTVVARILTLTLSYHVRGEVIYRDVIYVYHSANQYLVKHCVPCGYML